MKILALPRDDSNPYQRLLYDQLERRGARVAYVGELTASHTLNNLLLPLELAIRRIAGWRIVHLHWVYYFTLPAFGKRASAAWFKVVLAAMRAMRMSLVWTAHNVLPHEAVFPDDVSARRELVRNARLVIAHSDAALAELGQVVQAPSSAAVIPHGPYGVSLPAAQARPGSALRILFFGQIAVYKGVEDLLVAFDRAPDCNLELTIAGHCNDRALAARLRELAEPHADRVSLRLRRTPDAELPALLANHDALIFPFRHATTSGTVMLGLEAGRPVIVPALRAFDGMPVTRYTPGVAGLESALRELATADRRELRERGERGRAWVAEHLSWDGIAERTRSAFAAVDGS